MIDTVMWTEIQTNYTANIFGNTLLVGKPGSGKTSIIQSWQKCRYLPDEKAFWVSPKPIPEKVKITNANLFSSVSYYISPDAETLTSVIEQIKDVINTQKAKESTLDNTKIDNSLETDNEVDTSTLNKNYTNSKYGAGTDSSGRKKLLDYDEDFGEIVNYKYVIIFDDMTGIADRNNDFAHYLTVARKNFVSTISIFHQFNKSRQAWQNIMAAIDNVIFFRSTEPNNILQYLSQYASLDLKQVRYTPKKSSWLVKVYNEHVQNGRTGDHLLVHTGDHVVPGPGRFRCNTGLKPDFHTQFCFYPGDGGHYKIYKAKQCINGLDGEHLFSIQLTVGKTQAGDSINIPLRKEQGTNTVEENAANRKRKISSSYDDESTDSEIDQQYHYLQRGRGFNFNRTYEKERQRTTGKQYHGSQWRRRYRHSTRPLPKYLQ